MANTREDYLDEVTDDTAHRLSSKVNFEIRRLRRFGLTTQEIHLTLTTAIEFILNHEEDA